MLLTLGPPTVIEVVVLLLFGISGNLLFPALVVRPSAYIVHRLNRSSTGSAPRPGDGLRHGGSEPIE